MAQFLIGIILLQIFYIFFLHGQKKHWRCLETNYKGVFKKSLDVMMVVDPDSKTIIDVNKYTKEFLGYQAEELIGKNFSVLMPTNLSAENIDCKLNVFGSTFQEQEFIRKDKSKCFMDITFSMVAWGKKTVIFINFRDVSKQKSLKDQLFVEQVKSSKVFERLVEQEKFTIIGMAMGKIAHEINNILTPLSGNLDIIFMSIGYCETSKQYDEKKLVEKSEKIIEKLSKARRAADYLKNYIKQFTLVCHEPGNVKFVKLSLEMVLVQALKLAEAKVLKYAIKIHVDIEDNVYIQGHSMVLETAIYNLIVNAIDATSQGGVIHIKMNKKGSYVHLEIIDKGKGMPCETLQKCQKPFFTTKESKGVGLGLFYTKSVLEQHFGQVYIDSVVGKGTTVTLVFPLFEGEGETKEKNVSSKRNPLRILIAEDEEDVRTVIESQLEQKNHQVVATCNEIEALEKFSTKTFDVVLTDQSMLHSTSGNELAFNIKKINPKQPVVMLTAHGDMIKAQGHKIENIEEILTKPADIEELLDALYKVIAVKS